MHSSPTNTSSSSIATTTSCQFIDSLAANSSTAFFPQMISVTSTSEVFGSVVAQTSEPAPAIREDLLNALSTHSVQLKENDLSPSELSPSELSPSELSPSIVQKVQFTNILKTAFSPDLWVTSSFKLKNLTPNEAYNHSRLLFSSLNAKTAWLGIKTEIATLLPLNEANPNDTKAIKQTWQKLKNNLNKLIKYALEHQACLQRRQNDKMSEIPEEVDVNSYKNNEKKFASEKKNTRKNLKLAENTYSIALEKHFLDESTILENLPIYLHNKNAISAIIKKFPALEIETINQIIDKASEPATDRSILEPNLHLKETTFKVTRLIASETLWQSLTAQGLTEAEFKQEFFKFMLTSWESDMDIKFINASKIAKAKKNNDLTLECQLRNNWQFRENLYRRAYGIIHHILIFIRNKAKYDATDKNNIRTLNIYQKQLKLSTKKINQHYNDVYLKDYRSYINRKRKKWEGADLKVQIKKLNKDSHENLIIMRKNKKRDNQDIPKNISLINNVLAKLKTNNSVTEEGIKALIIKSNQENSALQASVLSNQIEKLENPKSDQENIFSVSSSEYELLIFPPESPLTQSKEITRREKRMRDFFDTEQPQLKKTTTELQSPAQKIDLSQKQTINQENLIKFSALSMSPNLLQLTTTIRPLFELPVQDSATPSQFLTSKDLDISESLPDDLFSNEPTTNESSSIQFAATYSNSQQIIESTD